MKQRLFSVFLFIFFVVRSNGQQDGGGFISHPPFGSNPSWPTLPYDWHAIYQQYYPENWFLDSQPEFPRPHPVNPDALQYLMAYNEMRYILSGLLHMYKKTQNATYLNEFVRQADSAFSNPLWFRDGENGHSDGFLGWGMKDNDDWAARLYLGEPLLPNTWYHMKIRVQDTIVLGTNRTRIRAWFQNRLFEAYLADTYTPGTFALFSGWAKTKYKNVSVRNLDNNTIFYDLNSSSGTFGQDWSKVKNGDIINFPEDTGN